MDENQTIDTVLTPNFVIRLNDIELDLSNRKILKNSKPFDLSHYRFAYLAILMIHANHSVSIPKLFQLARGDITETLKANSNPVQVEISRLRAQLGNAELLASEAAPFPIATTIVTQKSSPTCYMMTGTVPENQDYQTTLSYGDLVVDLISLSFRKDGQKFNLIRNEARFLVTLLENPEDIITDDQLYKALGLLPEAKFTNVLAVMTFRINAKAGSPRLITRIRGQGYRLTMAHEKINAPLYVPILPAQAATL